MQKTQCVVNIKYSVIKHIIKHFIIGYTGELYLEQKIHAAKTLY